AAQLDAIMRKLEALESPESARTERSSKEEPRLRQWLKSLRSSPLKEPESSDPFEEIGEPPMASSRVAAKPETNH
ncbi:MAG: hypothetical protein ACRD3V_04165, partial [Vicinamibacteria bacterium]